MLDIQTIKNILHDLDFTKEKIKNEIIEKEYFKNNDFRKIKKILIYEIAKQEFKR